MSPASEAPSASASPRLRIAKEALVRRIHGDPALAETLEGGDDR